METPRSHAREPHHARRRLVGRRGRALAGGSWSTPLSSPGRIPRPRAQQQRSQRLHRIVPAAAEARWRRVPPRAGDPATPASLHGLASHQEQIAQADLALLYCDAPALRFPRVQAAASRLQDLGRRPPEGLISKNARNSAAAASRVACSSIRRRERRAAASCATPAPVEYRQPHRHSALSTSSRCSRFCLTPQRTRLRSRERLAEVQIGLGLLGFGSERPHVRPLIDPRQQLFQSGHESGRSRLPLTPR